MDFQEIISKLNDYWAKQGCVIQQPYDIEVGAGTFNPATFLRVLGPEPWRVAYVEPSRRPTDGRYGDNPWRTGHYYQYQVILKPSPPDIQNIYLQSLEYLGIELRKHDVRFVEDDWESPTLGASGLGWEVWLDGSEITQYTYFQQMGSIDLDPISVEITYGLERITLDLQDIDSIFDIQWTKGITYGDIHYQSEVEFSRYYLDEANTAMLFMLFDTYEKEAIACLSKGLILPGTDYVLKCSHAFNVLDARGSISVTERASYIARVRSLARGCAQGYIKQREELSYPLTDRWSAEILRSAQNDKGKFIQNNGDEIDQTNKEIPQEADLLLEIGTEEVPSGYIQSAFDQMEELIAKLLSDNRIGFDNVTTMGTPRRLVLSVTGVSTQQPDRTVEVVGPPQKAAFDESGKPTKAAEGFARKYGANADDLEVKSTDRGDYVYLICPEKGRMTSELLSDELPKLIDSISFPKSMHFSSFEDGKLQFARPIRWIVALLGEDVVEFSAGRVKSDRYTFGHRFYSTEPIVLENSSLDDYKEILRNAGVIVDYEERCITIRKQVTDIMESEGCPIHIDEELLDTVTFLVEMPKTVIGTFSESYLSLPVEVLETAMKKHQRFFSLRSPLGESALLPKFITITNGVGDDDIIRHGNQRVLKSRLADADFFYNEDQKTAFADKIDRLKHVVFQEELGSLYDKSYRLKELASFLCDKIGLDDKTHRNASRAAELCKIDLTTHMVIEFPSLQGIMGGYYALNSGENEEVAKAIRCHYSPTSPGGALPENLAGSIVSIADKLDTIVGYFGTGNIPSGSQDPYALRRQAMGIVRILLEKELHLPLDQAIEKSISLYIRSFPSDTKDSVMEFLKGRISSILSERDFAYDVIDSILSVDSTDVINTIKRAEALTDFRARNDFDRSYTAFNRVIRILPDRKPEAQYQMLTVNEQLFKDEDEKNLYELMTKLEPDVRQNAKNGNYKDVLEQLSTLRDHIDSFFDNVMVMVEQDDLRKNRLTMLYRLADMFSLVADFSKLVE